MNNILIETSQYYGIFAQNFEEKNEIFKLRNQVMFKDRGIDVLSEYDTDSHDENAFLISIKEKEKNNVIATCRIKICSKNSEFYSQQFFKIDSFLNSKLKKAEISRVCVRSDHRSGQAWNLLWKSIGKKIIEHKIDLMFGLCSVSYTAKNKLHNFIEILKTKNPQIYFENEEITPLFKSDRLGESHNNCSESIKSLGLLPYYLNFGATIYGPPSFDSEMKYYDLFTIMDLKNISKFMLNRYFS